jgi:DNA-binding IclR family transcriptional regulator
MPRRGEREGEDSKADRGDATGNVSVLDKVFDLLDVLAEGDDLTAAELATRVEQPRSSVYRLLMSLRRRGWVEPGADRATFRLGLEFLRYSGVVLSRFDIRNSARPVLERIHEETGETTYLCVRSHDTSVCIDRIDGMFVGRAVLGVGGSLPLHVGAASRLLLAFEPESEWHRYLEENPLEKFTLKTETTPKKVLASLKAVREDGYAISDEDVTLGVASCGTPVFDHAGHIVGAIVISGMRQVIAGEQRESIIHLMQGGAEEISIGLGHGTSPGATAGARRRLAAT